MAITAIDALVLEAVLLTIAAPLAGAAIASTSSEPRSTIWRVTITVCSFIGASLAIALGASGLGALDVAVVVQSRIALAALAMALASLGALCVALLADALDGAAVSLLAALLAAGGLLGAGSASASLPQRAIDAGLLASPLVAATAAARIDVLRSPALYEFSPIAHRRLEYPDWWAVSVCFSMFTVCCLSGFAWKLRTRRSARIAF
jgi:hypothetical protein